MPPKIPGPGGRAPDSPTQYPESPRIYSDFDSFTGSSEAAVRVPCRSGEPDVGAIVVFSRRHAAYYRQALEWAHSVRNADVGPQWRKAAYELSFIADSIIRAIEGFAPSILRQIESGSAAEKLACTELGSDISKGFHAAISRVQEAMEEAIAASRSAMPFSEVPTSTGQPGYLYILTNRSLGSLVKIGKTTRSPRERVSELSAGTAIPTPFVLAFDAYVEDCSKAEEYVHSRLDRDGYRVASNREFFNVDVATAIKVVLEAQKAVSSRGTALD